MMMYQEPVKCHDLLKWLATLSIHMNNSNSCASYAAARRFTIQNINKENDKKVSKDINNKIVIDVLHAKREYIKHTIDNEKIQITPDRLNDLYSAVYIFTASNIDDI